MHSGLGAQHGGDANMAALMDSLGSWQLGGGGGMPTAAASMAHRGSVDGMAGVPVSHLCGFLVEWFLLLSRQ